MKKFWLLLSLIIVFSAVAVAQESEDLSATGIKWQEKEHLLTYNLSKEGLVKIRVGLYAGPVYRTIVNLENRPKGQNQERWDGKDEETKIDFLKYGKAHFCVDAPVKPFPDAALDVKFSEGANLIDGFVQLYQPNKIIVDVGGNLRPLFDRQSAELRVYLDNKLIKIERVNLLPYTFSLRIDDIAEGKHFLAINLWEALDFASVAYKSFEVLIPEKKSQAPVKFPQETKKAEGESLKGKIAFCRRDKDGFWQIFSSTLDGKYIRQLTSSAIDKRYPCYSRDGSEITYVNNLGELWIMDDYGGANRKIALPINCTEPRFSPDDKKIIFTSLEDVYRGSTKVWQVDLDTLQLTKLVNRPWLQYNPSYSPDGNQIVFTDGPELFEQDIRKLDLKTGDITQITDNGPYDYDMQAVFLNSGQEIVYSTNEGKGDYEIYKMDKFGRNKINLSQNHQSYDIMPAVSKDGQKIFFLSDRSGDFHIWQMNIDCSEVKQITQDTGVNSFSIYTE